MPSSFTRLYPDSIVLPGPAAPAPLLIFFITGNPGLVSYYTTYLALLHSLCAADPRTAAHLYAVSLAGFEARGPFPPAAVVAALGAPPYSLAQQIAHVDLALNAARDAVGTGVRTVLVGHSVGAYVLLEILARRGEGEVLGGVLLTPTIVDLRGSPSGRKVRAVASLPQFATVATLLAKLVLWPIPDRVLLALVRRVTGMPQDAAEATLAFLRSQRGIHQALFLLTHELRELTVDKWDDELWGVGAGAAGGAKLFFYFAREDHWVADEARDRIIAARAYAGKMGDDNKPVMEIADDGLPHAFCLRHSRPVAEKTFEYVRRMLQIPSAAPE